MTQANPLNLKNPSLFEQKCFIDNRYITAKSDKTISVFNPFNDNLIGVIPDLSSDEVKQAVESCFIAQKKWATTTAFERATILHKWADLIEQNKDDLAVIMTSEQGKPINESLGEIEYSVSYFRWFAEEAKRLYGDTLPSDKQGFRYMVLKQPIGVCACITPWNFPMAMFVRKLAPALASGCSMLVRPDSQTPFSALALGVLAVQAGLPSGLFQIVTGDAQTVGQVLTTHDKIAKFSFTGSTKTGQKLMAQCATTVKRVSMELGGNAPFIVFNDADLDKATDGLIVSKYRNAGQTCVCANRVFVHNSVYDDFVALYTQKVQKLKVGNGLHKDTDIGPLINEKALQKALSLIDDAVKQGAKLITGGSVDKTARLCLMPTVISEVTDNMQIASTEIFAPISAILRFDDDDEVIKRANDTEFGLACYFYTNNLQRSFKLCESLEYGIVGQNTGLVSTAVAPFGGIKQSGFGREGSKYGLDEYIATKYWAVKVD